MSSDRTVLVIGYGNPGRLDDGLGPALAAQIERRRMAGVTVEAAYQLNVEDAAAVAEHDAVVFADADVGGPEPFSFRRLQPKPALSFSSHSVEPDALLAMAHGMFGASTRGYVLGIRGYAFNAFGERLSAAAQGNLAAAAAFLEGVLRDGTLDEAADDDDVHSTTEGLEPCEDTTCRTENT